MSDEMLAPVIPQHEARFIHELSKSADYIPGFFLFLDLAIVALRALCQSGASAEVRSFAYNFSPPLNSLLMGYPNADLPPYLSPIFEHLLKCCEKRLSAVEVSADHRLFNTPFPLNERT